MEEVVIDEADSLVVKQVLPTQLQYQSSHTDTTLAFRDKATGRDRNRENQPTTETQDGTRPGRDRGPGVRRVGRGPAGPRRGGDRHSRTGVS